jgi:tRNA nucleotidyltransferase (CCA-adding enzyme)
MSEIVQLLEKTKPVAVYSLFSAVDQNWIHQTIISYLTKWKDLKTYTTGDTLKNNGLPPGPYYKGILNRLKASWIDKEITTQKGEEQLVNILIQDFWNQSREHS